MKFQSIPFKPMMIIKQRGSISQRASFNASASRYAMKNGHGEFQNVDKLLGMGRNKSGSVRKSMHFGQTAQLFGKLAAKKVQAQQAIAARARERAQMAQDARRLKMVENQMEGGGENRVEPHIAKAAVELFELADLECTGELTLNGIDAHLGANYTFMKFANWFCSLLTRKQFVLKKEGEPGYATTFNLPEIELALDAFFKVLG